MTKDDRMYVGHILEAIAKIERYLVSVQFETFLQTDLLIDAVARELSIVGEASSRLSEEFRDEHAEIPFRDIVGMRNIIVHEYTGMDAVFLWDTYEKDLPVLKKSLLPLRPNEA
jgi:uncharacterized protein with HEPN domain